MIESAILLGKVPDIHLIVVSINPKQKMSMTLTPAIQQKIPEVISTLQKVLVNLAD